MKHKTTPPKTTTHAAQQVPCNAGTASAHRKAPCFNWQKGLTQKVASEKPMRVPVNIHEEFVNDIYSRVDDAMRDGLDHLRKKGGITPSCKKGCSACCRYLILMNIAEAHALAQYIRRVWTADQIHQLKFRTKQWHDWDNSLPGRYPPAYEADLTDYIHRCPVLIDGACGAYPARPVICRTHFVTSHPRYCEAANDPDTIQAPPDVLSALVSVGSPFSAAIRQYIEDAGMDFTRSQMLLPHWLASEMGWDFDL